MKPTLFIGSSGEAMSIVDAFHLHLEDIAEVIPWKFGVFKSGESALESLVNALGRFDFAAFILSPDDLVESRGGKNASPRDNVVFELGLFIGRLGRDRVFIIHDRDTDIKVPTDLLGIKTIQYRGQGGRVYEDLLRSTRPAFRELESRMKELGLFSGVRPGKVARHGMLGYEDSFRNRETCYHDTVEGATEELYINGTALSLMSTNTWGLLVKKSSSIKINLLMLDPALADDKLTSDLIEVTYRSGVLHAAQVTVDKISTQAQLLPAEQRKNIKLYLTRYFMPIAAAVADPDSGHGKMVVEVIGASDPNSEYFSRPRYVLTEESVDASMFAGYWQQMKYLFSKDRSALYQLG